MIDFQSIAPKIPLKRYSVNRQGVSSFDHNCDMETFGDRVREARKKRGMTQKQLAAASGLSQTTISDIERGRNASSADIVALARAVGVSAEWLADGRGPRTLLAQESTPAPAPGSYAALAAAQGGHEGGTLLTGLSPAPDRKGRVPLISNVQAGHWTHAADLLQPGEAYEWIETGVTVRPHTFALRVTGDSMEPEFAHGTIVIVEPEMDAHPGDYVIAKNGDEEAVLKKLVRDGADLYLVPLNTRYPIKPLGTARIVGVVREAVKRYR